MKKLVSVFIATLLISVVSAQATKKHIQPKKTLKTVKAHETFSKTISSDGASYFIDDSVEIKNGHEVKTLIKVGASLPKEAWDAFVISQNLPEKQAFNLAITLLALKAQYTLKNTQSFEPLPKQFFSWNAEGNNFICDFKMMGRNGYGNMIETSELIFWSPNEK